MATRTLIEAAAILDRIDGPRSCGTAMRLLLCVSRGLATALLLGAATSGCAWSDAAADAIREGDRLIDAGQPDRAVEAYQRAVLDAPHDGRARVKLSRAYEAIGRYGPAATEAVRATDLLPDNAEVKLRAASLLLAVRRFEDADALASSVLRERPDDPQALTILANATANLPNNWQALVVLAERLRPPQRFHDFRMKLRPPVSPESDRTAEEFLRKAAAHAGDGEPQVALANLMWITGRLDESADVLKPIADRFPSHHTANHALGAYYLSRDRLEDGEKYLKRAAATPAPQNRAARWMLAGHYEYHKRDADALAVLEGMLTDRGVFAEASVRSAAILLRHERLAEALGRLEALLSRNPKEPRALAMKAEALYALGNFSGAATAARAALAVNPDSGRGRFAMGLTLAATGKPDEAFNELRHAMRLEPKALDIPIIAARLAMATAHYELALDWAREAALKRPDDEEADLTIVAALTALRQYAAAEAHLQPLLKRDPDAVEAMVLLGRIREGQGRRPAAREAYGRATQLNPGSLEALGGLVSLDLAEGNTRAARARVDQAYARYPDEPALLQIASQVFRAEGDVERLESTLRRSQALDPARADVAVQLAELLDSRNRREDALAALRTTLHAQPAAIEARTRLARLLESMGRRDEARAEYERVVDQDSTAVVASTRLALIRLADGRNLDEIIILLTRARQRAPADPDVSHALGLVHLQSGRADVALPYLEEAVRLRPGDPMFLYVLGTAYAADKQPAKAREAFTRALEADTPFADRDKARAALESLR
jgi:tetratricopeptide (TPR) repeat protein